MEPKAGRRRKNSATDRLLTLGRNVVGRSMQPSMEVSLGLRTLARSAFQVIGVKILSRVNTARISIVRVGIVPVRIARIDRGCQRRPKSDSGYEHAGQMVRRRCIAL